MQLKALKYSNMRRRPKFLVEGFIEGHIPISPRKPRAIDFPVFSKAVPQF